MQYTQCFVFSTAGFNKVTTGESYAMQHGLNPGLTVQLRKLLSTVVKNGHRVDASINIFVHVTMRTHF